MRSSSRGQALIESVLALPLAMAATTGLFGLSLSLATSLLTRHCLQEFIVCHHLFPEPENCETRFKNQIQKFLFLGKLKDLRFSPTENQAWVRISLPVFGDFQLQEKQSPRKNEFSFE